ncbi:SulP family inorganic anion transporter [Streptomyces sp. RB6PN23]|uniref:SulP family inorganic anion transporter n=2 Tax=Streptomyces silvisoli TaxID=3034235 RepID=A0ABT5ZPR7_9ACTN|nr:SulP family inorganic anion transporter [Streptomyces silvisoli]
MAGVTVAITALPLALGLGAASGLGAQAGLVSAVTAGAVAALFGGSRLQISGPTGVLTVVLAPIAHDFGASGVLTAGLLAGLLLMALALVRASGYMRYVPAPVIKGFTVGSAAVIVLQQTPPALGVATHSGGTIARTAARALSESATHPNWAAVTVCSAVVLVRLVGARWRPDVPFALVGVAAATVVAHFARLSLPRIGHLPAGIPHPSWKFLAISAVPDLLPSAATVAVLVALEALMTAAAADSMREGEPYDGDRELFGQGMANLVTPLVGGLAATGTVVRTAVNVRSGASSRLAALVHSTTLALVAFAAAPVVAEVPLSALAGVLIATAVRMVDLESLRMLVRADRGQAAVAAVTAAVTLAFDLVTAVAAGIALATALALRAVVHCARVEHQTVRSERSTSVPESRVQDSHGAVATYVIDGPLLFASAERLLNPVKGAQASVVILHLSRITAVDATGLLALRDVITSLGLRGCMVLACGIRDPHRHTMEALGVLTSLRAAGHIFDTDIEAEAVAWAKASRHDVPPQSNARHVRRQG